MFNKKPKTVEDPPSPPKYNCPKDIQRVDLFIWIRRTMWVAAMCPLELERYFPKMLHWLAAFLDFSFEMFLYFVSIHIGILYVCTLYLNFGDGDLELIVNCMIQTIIYFWSIVMKLYFRRLQGHNLKDMMNFINHKYSTRSAVGFTYVTMDECLAMSNKWLNIYVFSCFGGTIFWLVLPIAYGDHSLPLSCWYPFDYKEPFVYEILYFLQSVGQLQVAAAFAGSSGFHMVMSILISGQYDNLYCSLKNIIATGAINFQCSSSKLRKLHEQQSIADPELNQYYCSIERSIKMECFAHLHDVKHNKSAGSLDSSIKDALKACVLKHRYILKALQKMEKFFNPIWFFKNGESIFLMCLVAFVSVKSTTANTSLFKIMSLGQYLLLVAWEMLIICYFGEMVYLNSARCGEALMRCPWYLHAPKMKNDILIFLMNANKAFKLTAGKILVLNVDRFRGIITTAFSFMTLLQKMDQRD